MNVTNELCDLCNSHERQHDSLLCESCSESVARLMLVAEWEANRASDKARNKLQVEILLAYQRIQLKEAFKTTTF